MAENGVEGGIVGLNHFRVRNLSGSATAVFPGPRASETAGGLGVGGGGNGDRSVNGGVRGEEKFEGRAGRVVGGGGWIRWVGMGVVVSGVVGVGMV